MNVYNKLFKLLDLSDAHRSELKTKRGFTDETIDRCGFRSAGKSAMEAVNKLKEEVPVETLTESGITKSDGSPVFMIEDEAILIPFFSGTKVVYFRAHRNGISGITPPIYVPRKGTQSNYLVLAESEYKAAALSQLEIPVIGLQGISMYSKDNFPALMEHIVKTGVKKVVILFDNEDKVSKSSAYYKDEAKKRYDVDYYQFIIAHQITRSAEDIECSIATLPNSWRVNGGVDIDQALAAGRTQSDFIECIKDGINHQLFRKRMRGEQRKIVEGKLDRYFFWSPVEIEYDHYVMTSKDGAKIPISNFYLDIEHNYMIDENDFDRGVVIIGKRGKKIGAFAIGSEVFSSIQRFKDWIGRKGSYWFTGTQGHLDEINKRLVEFNDGNVIHMPFLTGYYKEHGYLFGNCFIRKNKTVKADKGVSWDGKIGYKSQPLQEDTSISTISMHLEKFDFKNAMKKVFSNWSGYAHALGLGWITATVYTDLIVEAFGKFPILLVGGMKESGKTSLCEVLCAFCGVEGNASNAEEATRVGIARELSYYSNLPTHIDEYRATARNFGKFDSFFRSVYDRQGAVKGIQHSKRVRRMSINACLMISGEASPTDSALLTRCVNVIMDKTMIVGHEWEWIQANKHRFSTMYRTLSEKRSELGPKVIKSIDKIRKSLNEDFGLTHRHALNYGIVLGTLDVIVPDMIDNLSEFMTWITAYAQSKQIEAEDEHIMSHILYDLAVLQGSGKLKDTMLRLNRDKSGEYCIYIHAKDAFNYWTKYMRDSGRAIPDGFNAQTVAGYMNNGLWNTVSQRKSNGGYRKWSKAKILDVYTDLDSLSTLTEGWDQQEVVLGIFRGNEKTKTIIEDDE